MASLKRVFLSFLCLFVVFMAVVTANEATEPAAESGTVSETVSLEGDGRMMEEKENIPPSTLTDEEDAAIRAIWAQLEEKDKELLTVKEQAKQYQAMEADLRAKMSSTATVIEEHAKLKTTLAQTQKELEEVKLKLVEKPAVEKVVVDNPVTEEALQQLKERHHTMTEELNKIKRELEQTKAAAASTTVTSPDTSVVDKLSSELSMCQSKGNGLMNELKIKTEQVADLQATIKKDQKPKLSNRPQDDVPKKTTTEGNEDINSSMPALDVNGFIVFLQEKYTMFLSDLEKSPVLSQISETIHSLYSDTQRYVSKNYSALRRYMKKVLIPYLQKKLIPQIQQFYSQTLVPYLTQLFQKIANNYAIIQPKVLKWLNKTQKKAYRYIKTVVVPAYEKHVRPPVLNLYTTHLKPTVDDVIIPWYTVQISPYITTITTAIQSFYHQHLRRHVEPVFDIVWRQFNLILYKTLNFLEPENIVESITFLAKDVYELSQLAHETFVTQMKLNPTMRALFGKNLNMVIQICLYVGSFLILFTLWRIVLTVGTVVVLYVFRPILVLVLLPFIMMMWITSSIGTLIFGKRIPRPKSNHANTGTNFNSKSSANTMDHHQGGPSMTTRSAAAYGVNGSNNGQQLHRENGYEDSVASSSPSQPPSAVSKPSRPPRSVANNLMPHTTTTHSNNTMPVGSPFPVTSTTEYD